jgi:hypothetical protein
MKWLMFAMGDGERRIAILGHPSKRVNETPSRKASQEW